MFASCKAAASAQFRRRGTLEPQESLLFSCAAKAGDVMPACFRKVRRNFTAVGAGFIFGERNNELIPQNLDLETLAAVCAFECPDPGVHSRCVTRRGSKDKYLLHITGGYDRRTGPYAISYCSMTWSRKMRSGQCWRTRSARASGTVHSNMQHRVLTRAGARCRQESRGLPALKIM